MKDGFIRVAAATPDLKVADPVFNREQTWKMMQEAASRDVKILVFPELGLTGYTCSDLFLQDTLIDQAKEELLWLLDASKDMDMLTFIGLPWMKDGKLYNVAAAIKDGELLGLVPKRHLPNYSEFYELRHFNPGPVKPDVVEWGESLIPFGSKILFRCTNIPELIVAAELCEDVWTMDPPSVSHAKAGATVIANCSASDETTGKAGYRETLIAGQSARLVCAYIYANAGEGESTQDLVFGGHDIIAENGNILAESERFKNGMITADIDLYRLKNERRRMTTCQPGAETEDYDYMDFTLNKTELTLKRYVDPAPFVPSNEKERTARCEEILTIQAMGLKKRLAHTGAKSAVVGISGGLDSTLALLVTARAFDMLGIPRENILSVTMPCFGTTDRTYNNAVTLTKKLGATLKEVNIRKAVSTHFEDIGHDPAIHDVTYENSQARYRTLILMDLANKTNRYRRYVGAGAGLGYLQRRPYVHVRRERVCSEDACSSSCPLLRGYLRRLGPGRCTQRCSRYPGEPGASAAGGRKDLPEDGGPGRTLRASRFLPLLYSPLRLSSGEDLPPGEDRFRGSLRGQGDLQVVKYLLPPVLRTAVQAFLPAGRPEGRICCGFSER